MLLPKCLHYLQRLLQVLALACAQSADNEIPLCRKETAQLDDLDRAAKKARRVRALLHIASPSLPCACTMLEFGIFRLRGKARPAEPWHLLQPGQSSLLLTGIRTSAAPVATSSPSWG